MKLWNGVIAAGYGNGQIRLYEAAHGTLRAQVSAHARWIYALDLAPLSGKVSPSHGGGASQSLARGLRGATVSFPVSRPQPSRHVCASAAACSHLGSLAQLTGRLCRAGGGAPPLWANGYVQVSTFAACLVRLAQLGPPLAALALSWKGRLLWEGSPIQGCKASSSPSPVEALSSVSFSCPAAVCRRGLLRAGLGTELQSGHRQPGGEPKGHSVEGVGNARLSEPPSGFLGSPSCFTLQGKLGGPLTQLERAHLAPGLAGIKNAGSRSLGVGVTPGRPSSDSAWEPRDRFPPGFPAPWLSQGAGMPERDSPVSLRSSIAIRSV